MPNLNYINAIKLDIIRLVPVIYASRAMKERKIYYRILRGQNSLYDETRDYIVSVVSSLRTTNKISKYDKKRLKNLVISTCKNLCL